MENGDLPAMPVDTAQLYESSTDEAVVHKKTDK